MYEENYSHSRLKNVTLGYPFNGATGFRKSWNTASAFIYEVSSRCYLYIKLNEKVVILMPIIFGTT